MKTPREKGFPFLYGIDRNSHQLLFLFFRGDLPEPAERFARENPYVLNGLVTFWKGDPWIVVVGDEPASPMNP